MPQAVCWDFPFSQGYTPSLSLTHISHTHTHTHTYTHTHTHMHMQALVMCLSVGTHFHLLLVCSLYRTASFPNSLLAMRREWTLTPGWWRRTPNSARQKHRKVHTHTHTYTHTHTHTHTFFVQLIPFWLVLESHLAVTLARALELKHKPSVVYALATATSSLFTQAGGCCVVVCVHACVCAPCLFACGLC